jgi:hypothetical protein
MTRVGPVVHALAERARVTLLSFNECGHRTSPNRSFKIYPVLHTLETDAVLWIEGGPFPSDFDVCLCKKACWLINAHLEPTLSNFGAGFDVRLSTLKTMSANEEFRWIPLTASNTPLNLGLGVNLLYDDPVPASQAQIALSLGRLREVVQSIPAPVAICPSQATRPHAGLFDSLKSGAITCVDVATDIRDVVHAGEHVLSYSSPDDLSHKLRDLSGNPGAAAKVHARGPLIVEHLHTPEIRAEQILDAIEPNRRILGGARFTPRISILTSCYKYLRRFRLYLQSIATQQIAPGSLEIVIADPGSPDGLKEYVAAFAKENPHLRIVHLPLNHRYRRNRGLCINRAFDASIGNVIISTDGDLLFPPDLIDKLGRESQIKTNRVLGIRRVFLNRETTQEILNGSLDWRSNYSRLENSPGDGETSSTLGVLGYCQVVAREGFAKARYPEEFDMINQSDIVFLERLKQFANIYPFFFEELTSLHLWHPRNWAGTEDFL